MQRTSVPVPQRHLGRLVLGTERQSNSVYLNKAKSCNSLSPLEKFSLPLIVALRVIYAFTMADAAPIEACEPVQLLQSPVSH